MPRKHLTIPPLTAQDRARFWQKVCRDKPDECWNWLASQQPGGYGQFWLRDKMLRAHRVAWTIERGPIPEWASVLHRCDNVRCCNSRHLFLGTQKENLRDRTQKGRIRAPERLEPAYVRDPRWQCGQADFVRGELNGRAKLTAPQVRAIRAEYACGTTTEQDIALRYAVTPGQIDRIINRKSWSHLH